MDQEDKKQIKQDIIKRFEMVKSGDVKAVREYLIKTMPADKSEAVKKADDNDIMLGAEMSADLLDKPIIDNPSILDAEDVKWELKGDRCEITFTNPDGNKPTTSVIKIDGKWL